MLLLTSDLVMSDHSVVKEPFCLVKQSPLSSYLAKNLVPLQDHIIETLLFFC